MRRVCSSTSGPLIRIPSCAPRPVPTSNAVGVASPSAHGQAMISTATAAVKAAPTRPVEHEPARQRRQRDRQHDGDEDAGDAVGEPLDRRLAGLSLGDEPGDLRERRFAADPRRADDEPPVGVDRRAGDLGAPARPRPGTDSPVSIDWSTADSPSTTTPSVAIFSPGRTTKGRRPRAPRPARAARAVAEDVRVLRPELEQSADRGTRAAARPRLEIPPEKNQGRDHARDLEVDVCIEPCDENDNRPDPGGERAERDERVHRRGAMPRIQRGGAMEREPGPEHDRRRECERDPLPPGELQRRDHRQQEQRHRQHQRHEQPPPHRRRRIGLRPRLGRNRSRVARGLDSANQLVDPHAPRRRPTRARSQS